MNQDTPILPGLPAVCGKPVTARFDGGRLSSDGGVLALSPIEAGLGIADRLSQCLPDARDATRVIHTHADMIRARTLAIACGHEDCDDLDQLRTDPALKMACDRLPETGHDLMSQPTLSRLENLPSWRDLARMGLEMIDIYCDSYSSVPDQIVLDIDDTSDYVHGGQQLRLFNSYHDEYCFQPILIFDGATGKPIAALIRPGKRPSGEEVAMVLRHVIRRIRRNWPRVKIMVRGDSHYCAPQVLDLLDKEVCHFSLGLSINKKLKALAAAWCEDVAMRRAISKKPVVRRYFQTSYQAGSWSKPVKVIARVEATEKGVDVRFVVTDLPGRAKNHYEKVYCRRGRMENMIKDYKLYTRADRTSCHRWEANQFRLMLHMGAYWLLLGLRAAAPKRSAWRKATFETLRCAFLKVAVRVEELKSRIKVALPTAYPHKTALIAITGSVTALGP